MSAARAKASPLIPIARELSRKLGSLQFGPPVVCVYNPLDYAWDLHAQYLGKYGHGPKRVIFMGMNPGPWGMVQTGVPFGDVAMVRDWLGITGASCKPPCEHPKRPILGLDCRRSEVSGSRLWGWAKRRYGTPDSFFATCFVHNYCPLAFMEESGRNFTPDKLPRAEREPLLDACDEALSRAAKALQPEYCIGIGNFAESRLRTALPNFTGTIGRIPHPSPASPAANRGWEEAVDAALSGLGL